MNRVFSSKAPGFVSRLLGTRCSISNAPAWSRAASFSAMQIMKPAEECKNSAPPFFIWLNVRSTDANADPGPFKYPFARSLRQNTDSDPFNYTSGRWLRFDALQRKSRYLQFDFEALCRRVIALCPGSSSIASWTKKEGGFNRIFIFHTDNAKRVVARLPFPLAGPQRLVTNSEVATIQFCRPPTTTDQQMWPSN